VETRCIRTRAAYDILYICSAVAVMGRGGESKLKDYVCITRLRSNCTTGTEPLFIATFDEVRSHLRESD